MKTKNHRAELPQPPGLTLPFQEAQDVSLPYRTLDVSYNGTTSSSARIGIHEFNTDLSHITGVTRASQDSVDFGEFDWLILWCFEGLQTWR